MAEVDPCVNLQPIDKLLEWWRANRSNMCRENRLMAKKYDDLAGQISSYRSQVCRILTLRHVLEQRDVPDIDGLRQLHPDLIRKFGLAQDIFELRGDVDRELDRLLTGGGGGGLVIQAHVTRWLHEAGFRIADIEVEYEDCNGDKHTFDIDIEDTNGHGYDVEVWYGTGPLAHEEMLTTTRAMYVGGELYMDPGKRYPGMKYVSEYGGIGDDSEANFHTLMKKMRQMRKGRTGVVVACIPRDPRPWLTLIPKEWGPRLPENRCAIALRIGDGGFTEERRGTGYLVCSPKFGHAGEAEAMIASLKFEYVDYPTPLRYNLGL